MTKTVAKTEDRRAKALSPELAEILHMLSSLEKDARRSNVASANN